jgi:hypothetical protein
LLITDEEANSNADVQVGNCADCVRHAFVDAHAELLREENNVVGLVIGLDEHLEKHILKAKPLKKKCT